MTVESTSPDDDILESLVDELTACARRGERPDIDGLVSRYPHLAARIRSLAPALFAIEGAAARSVEERVHVPKRLGHYRILHFLGGGSMGMVYEAIRESGGPSPERPCAVKILLPGRTRLDHERFRREAGAADRLRHPNIVPIHGIHETDGLHYLAMDLIAGEGVNRILNDLRRLRDSSIEFQTPTVAHDSIFGIPESNARETSRPRVAELLAAQPATDYHRSIASLVLQVADALAHAHGHGVVHRDVKPSNILVDSKFKAWIADFGLAKIESEESLSRRGEVVGTLRYIAPERFRGISQPPCDIYGLGVTLYEMLTLRPAFPHDNVHELHHAVAFLSPPVPRVIDPRIPPDLELIVLKAIAREPKNRYATMVAFRDDLIRFLDGRTPLAMNSSLRHRHPSLAVSIALLALASLPVTSFFAWQTWRYQIALRNTEAELRISRVQQLESLLIQARDRPQGRPLGRQFETLELLDRADGLARQVGRRDDPAVDSAIRDITLAAKTCIDLESVPTGDRLPPGTRRFEYDPDGRTVGRIDRDGTLHIHSSGSESPTISYGKSNFVEFQFLPDTDRVIAQTAAHELRFLPTHPRAIPTATPIAAALKWHVRRDGKRLAVLHSDGTLGCYRTSDGAAESRVPVPTLGGIGLNNWTISHHPHRPIVALIETVLGGPAIFINSESGTILERIVNRGKPTACEWHPDGKCLSIAVESADGSRFIQGFDSTDRFRPVESWPTDDTMIELAFHPSGERLASLGRKNTVTIIDTNSGRALLESPSYPEGVRLRWSCAGDRLAGYVSEGSIHFWKFAIGRSHLKSSASKR